MMKKVKYILLIALSCLFLSACDAGEQDVEKEIKFDFSTQYNVPVSDVQVEKVEYGISTFTTNQFKVTIESKSLSFYLVEKDGTGDSFRVVPMKNK